MSGGTGQIALAVGTAVVLPLIAIGAIIFAQLWRPLSVIDRTLFSVALIATVIGATIVVRVKPRRVWLRFLLLSVPTGLLVFPFAHSWIIVASAFASSATIAWSGRVADRHAWTETGRSGTVRVWE